MIGADRYEKCSVWHCRKCGEHIGIFKDEYDECPKCKEKLRYINKEADSYYLMSKFLCENQMDSCNICNSIDLYNGNYICDKGKEYCVIGIADYLRQHKILKANRR